MKIDKFHKVTSRSKEGAPKRVQVTYLFDQVVAGNKDGHRVIVQRSGTAHLHLEADGFYHHKLRDVVGNVTDHKYAPADVLKTGSPVVAALLAQAA